jgi:hypothetical protein
MTDSLFRNWLEGAPQCPILVNGVECRVPIQLSVAAALLYLGHLAIRAHPVSGEPRAPFCHMGACFDCLVTIDGQPKQRACLAQVTPNMNINTVTAGPN